MGRLPRHALVPARLTQNLLLKLGLALTYLGGLLTHLELLFSADSIVDDEEDTKSDCEKTSYREWGNQDVDLEPRVKQLCESIMDGVVQQ